METRMEVNVNTNKCKQKLYNTELSLNFAQFL